GTKVWHNPELDTYARRRGQPGAENVADSATDRRAAKAHRAALEALFAPRRDAPAEAAEPVKRDKRESPKPGRIVLPPPPESDPRALERQRLLSRLLVAEGRPNITKAANELLRAGFTFPDDQDVYLQLLEHSDEEQVQRALAELDTILVRELPKR